MSIFVEALDRYGEAERELVQAIHDNRPDETILAKRARVARLRSALIEYAAASQSASPAL